MKIITKWFKGQSLNLEYKGGDCVEVSVVVDEPGDDDDFPHIEHEVICDGQMYRQRYMGYAEDFYDDEEEEVLDSAFEDYIFETFIDWFIEKQKEYVIAEE